MKTMIVESANGYMASGPSDTMLWTPSLDKQVFRLITTMCGTCICSKHTYELLPPKMLADPARNYIIAEKTGSRSLPALAQIYPSAMLIGGPIFLKAAYNQSLLDTIIVSTTKNNIEPNERYKNPFAHLRPDSTIKIGELTFRIFKIKCK